MTVGTGARWRRAARRSGCIALVALAFGDAPGASAQCSGTGCFPSSGYTEDRYWNCGLFYGATRWGGYCFFPGQVGFGTSTKHWAWGSADYDGNGDNVGVVIEGVPASSGYGWGSWGAVLARACWATNCVDQDTYQYHLGVNHNHYDHRHTIYGHGKA